MQQTSVSPDQQYEASASAWFAENPAAPQFKRGDHVVCKPGILFYQAAVGEVQAVVAGNVIVYFEGVGAVPYFPHELAIYAPAERLPLATPVRILSNGVEGVISAYASADSTRYQVTWFSRHFWAVRYAWVNRSNLEVIGSAASAESWSPAPAA